MKAMRNFLGVGGTTMPAKTECYCPGVVFEVLVIASSNKVYPPETVARDILRGVERNRYIILTGLDSTFFYWLSNLAGPLQYPIIDLIVADAVRRSVEAIPQLWDQDP